MKPSELFGVMVRTIGLLLVLSSAWGLFFAGLNLVLGGPGNVAGMVIMGVPVFCVGLWLLRGAESFVRFAYPEEEHDGQSSS